jgi:hypothetical protein
MSCVGANVGPDGAAARSQSCLSFDVAVVLAASSSLPRHQRNYATTKQHNDDLPSRDILESTILLPSYIAILSQWSLVMLVC